MLTLEVLALSGTHLYAILQPLYGSSSHWSYLLASYRTAMALGQLPRIGLYLFVIYASGDPLSQFGLRRITWPRDLFWAGAAGAMIFILYWVDYSGISHVSPFVGKPWHAYGRGLAPVWLLGLCNLLVGLAEELAFRGYLIPRLEELLKSTWMAVIIQALFFGLVHSYEGFRGMVVTALFGLIMGVTFTRVRSIWPLALVHAATDFVILYGVLQRAVP